MHLRQWRGRKDPLKEAHSLLQEAQLQARVAWEIVDMLLVRFGKLSIPVSAITVLVLAAALLVFTASTCRKGGREPGSAVDAVTAGDPDDRRADLVRIALRAQSGS